MVSYCWHRQPFCDSMSYLPTEIQGHLGALSRHEGSSSFPLGHFVYSIKLVNKEFGPWLYQFQTTFTLSYGDKDSSELTPF